MFAFICFGDGKVYKFEDFEKQRIRLGSLLWFIGSWWLFSELALNDIGPLLLRIGR